MNLTSTPDGTISIDETNQIIIWNQLPWWMRVARKPLRRFANAIISRAKECSMIDSRSFHAMHSLIDGVCK